MKEKGRLTGKGEKGMILVVKGMKAGSVMGQYGDDRD